MVSRLWREPIPSEDVIAGIKILQSLPKMGYRASCSCGWESEKTYRLRGGAIADADFHHSSAHPRWFAHAEDVPMSREEWEKMSFADDDPNDVINQPLTFGDDNEDQ